MPVAMIGPKVYVTDSNGNPVVGAKIYAFETDGVTPKDTYNAENGAVNSHPVLTDAAGRADVYLDGVYQIEVDDADDNQLYTANPVTSANEYAKSWIHKKTASFASTTTFTITGDVTANYTVGRRIKLNDATVLYGVITVSSYSSPNTTVTVKLEGGGVVSASLDTSWVSISEPESKTLNTSVFVDTISDLKALDVGGVLDGESRMLLGHTTIGDGGGGVFYWDASDSTTDNNGTHIQPSAGGVGRWIRDIEGEINVRYFGIIDDAVNDQSSKIDTFFDYACDNTLTANVIDGTYIYNTAKGSAFGSGNTDSSIRVVCDKGALFKRTTRGNNPGASGIQMFQFGGTDSKIELVNFSYDGDRDNIAQTYTDNGTISGTKVVGVDEQVNVLKVVNVESFTLNGGNISNAHGLGLACESTPTCEVRGARFKNCSAGGIRSDNCTSTVIVGNFVDDIALLPDSFLVDSVAATISDGDDWHMQFGDGISVFGGQATVTNNMSTNVSRTAYLVETRATQCVIANNTYISNNDNLKCGNPHGSIWCELGQDSIVANNIILQKLRYNSEKSYYSMVLSRAATTLATETYNVHSNLIVHYNYRTAAATDHGMRILGAQDDGDAVYLVKNNNILLLDTQTTGACIYVSQAVTGLGTLDLVGNYCYNLSSATSARTIAFDVDSSGQKWFEKINVESNDLHCPNKPAPSASSEYSMWFDPIASYAGIDVTIRNNRGHGPGDGIFFQNSNEDLDRIRIDGNDFSGFDFRIRVATNAIIDNNNFYGSTNTTTNELQIANGVQLSKFTNNSVKNRTDLNTTTYDFERTVIKQNTFTADTTNNRAVDFKTGNFVDVIFEDNAFLATANSQVLCRVEDLGNMTRCSLSKNTFSSGGFTSVNSYDWQSGGSPANTVIGGNIDLGTTETGTGAPRNTGI